MRETLALSSRTIVHATRAVRLEHARFETRDGLATTVHIALHARNRTTLRVRRMPGLMQLERWCADTGTDEALVGGFYLRETAAMATLGSPLGELWIDGERQDSTAFSAPWGATRAAVAAHDGDVRIDLRERLPERPLGDLLQAGPLLVRDGAVVTGDDEGFSAGAHQFDSDITDGRHPRAALGYNAGELIAVACDGRSQEDCGLTIAEVAELMAGLGAEQALNLDGGGSASLVSGGRLVNTPRESHGIPVAGGRAIATACVFEAI